MRTLESKNDAPRRPRSPATPFVEVLNGRVTLEGQPVSLSRRELQLVVALALKGPSEASVIADELWPNADADCARQGLKVYVHRVRRRLGHAFIVHEYDRYRLCHEAVVDLSEVEGLLKTQRNPDVGSTDTDSLLNLARRLRRVQWPSKLEGGTWLAAHATRLAEAGRTVALRAARCAFDCSLFDRAISILKELLVDDPCDEEAQELILRVHLSRGEQGAAAREYRRYAAMLRAELDVAPSKALQKMFFELS